MRLEPQEQALYDQIAGFTVIDAHEHLPPEEEWLEREADLFHLFAQYVHTDIVTAGMSREEFDSLLDSSRPLEERWRKFAPYWGQARHTSFSRAAEVVAREVYGLDGIGEGTYRELDRRIREEQKPGIYERVLGEVCKIETALVIRGAEDPLDHAPLRTLRSPEWYVTCRSRREVEERTGGAVGGGDGLEAMAAYLGRKLEQWREEGVVGLKMYSRELENPERAEAERAWRELPAEETEGGVPRPVYAYLMHQLLEQAGELGLPVAVHTGMLWSNWRDFPQTNPLHMLPILGAHRRTKFDLYHAGIPWVRELGVVAKGYPNVWLNLCWAPIISEEMTVSALDEWMDLVPANKFIAFGGDYQQVIAIYGHLVLTREAWARVLGRRVRRGKLREDEAVELARRAFYTTPQELYGL